MTQSVFFLVGIDDTDLIDTPGTNKLAQHIAANLETLGNCVLITRHQLLQDPRVPCTKKNGCACLKVNVPLNVDVAKLLAFLRKTIFEWVPVGSDPGFCVAREDTASQVSAFGRLCQSEIVTQAMAYDLAKEHDIHLEGLGGTRDGVIGALAAVGLASSGNDGRVIYKGEAKDDLFDATGLHKVEDILARGVDRITVLDSLIDLTSGVVDVGKRLRPNLRNQGVVLYVEPTDVHGRWSAIKFT